MRIPRNHLLVSSLVALLEQRQNVLGGGAAAAQLAEKYAMDVGRLESLAHSVNVPRVREGGVRYVKDAQSGEETVISEVGLPFLVRVGFGVECFCLGRVVGIGSPVGPIRGLLHSLSSSFVGKKTYDILLYYCV
jgi:hypothetical protein